MGPFSSVEWVSISGVTSLVLQNKSKNSTLPISWLSMLWRLYSDWSASLQPQVLFDNTWNVQENAHALVRPWWNGWLLAAGGEAASTVGYDWAMRKEEAATSAWLLVARTTSTPIYRADGEHRSRYQFTVGLSQLWNASQLSWLEIHKCLPNISCTTPNVPFPNEKHVDRK